MTYEQLKRHMMAFFSDTSRTPQETKEGLESLIEEAKTLEESIEVSDE